jgi:hypothetical protein
LGDSVDDLRAAKLIGNSTHLEMFGEFPFASSCSSVRFLMHV